MKFQNMSASLVIGIALLLMACGGDGNGNKGMSSGIFVDSPVDGLHFTTSSNPMGGFTSHQCHPNSVVSQPLTTPLSRL
jgi:hypothetical protein